MNTSRQRSTENTSADSLNDYAIDSHDPNQENYSVLRLRRIRHTHEETPLSRTPFRVAEHEGKTVQAAWDFGHTVTEKITPERIAYCAGYTAKKYGDENRYETWRMPDGIGRKKITGWINSETGEYVVRKPDQEGTWKPEIAWYWQQPFLQMSMKPGIGGFAREKYKQSWKKCAVLNGTTIASPRYLKEAWKATATTAEIIKVENEIEEQMLDKILNPEQRKAAEAMHKKRLEMKAERNRNF